MSIFTTLSKNFKKNASLLYMKLYSPKAWSYQARGQEEPIGNHKQAFIINSILHYLAFFSHETLTWHWRIQGGRQGRAPPPGSPNSFIFMQFSAKN